MSIETVIFDWGGTLSVHVEVDLLDLWRLAAKRLALETGRDAHELCEKLVAAELRYWDGVHEVHRTGTLGEILAEESRSLGLDVTAAVISEAAQQHLDAWTPHIRHHPDAVSTLSTLRARGIKIGLLSNTHWPASFHEHFLERDGLAPFIAERAYTSNMLYSKPHPEAFLHVARKLGVDPARAVFVGDRPIDDVRGSQHAGMRGVWRPHAHSPALGDVRPDAIIQELSELPALLTDW